MASAAAPCDRVKVRKFADLLDRWDASAAASAATASDWVRVGKFAEPFARTPSTTQTTRPRSMVENDAERGAKHETG